jgi:hypothetical protein
VFKVKKVVGTNFGTRLKVLIMVFLACKTFDLVKKVASSFWHYIKSLNNALKSLNNAF